MRRLRSLFTVTVAALCLVLTASAPAGGQDPVVDPSALFEMASSMAQASAAHDGGFRSMTTGEDIDPGVPSITHAGSMLFDFPPSELVLLASRTDLPANVTAHPADPNYGAAYNQTHGFLIRLDGAFPSGQLQETGIQFYDPNGNPLLPDPALPFGVGEGTTLLTALVHAPGQSGSILGQTNQDGMLDIFANGFTVFQIDVETHTDLLFFGPVSTVWAAYNSGAEVFDPVDPATYGNLGAQITEIQQPVTILSTLPVSTPEDEILHARTVADYNEASGLPVPQWAADIIAAAESADPAPDPGIDDLAESDPDTAPAGDDPPPEGGVADPAPDSEDADEPVVVDVTPDDGGSGSGPLIWIVLGVIVVAGVTIVIVRRLRVGAAGSAHDAGSEDASPDGSAPSSTGAVATAIAMPGAMVMDPCADERAAVAKAESLLATLTEIAEMRLKNYREKLEDEPYADKERRGDEVEAHDKWYKQVLLKDELLQTAAKDRDEAQLALEAAKRALAECEKNAPPPPEPLDPDTWIPAGKPAAADPGGTTEFKIRMMGGGDGGILLGGGLYKFEIRDMAGNSKLYTFLGGGGVAGAKGGAYGTGAWTEFTTTQPMKVDEFGGWGQIWGASVQVVAGVSAAEIVFFPDKSDVTTQTASGVGASSGLSFGASALHGYWWPE